MYRVQLPLVAALLGAAAISLTGCGGGGGNTPVVATGGTTVTVSPSLGKFSAGAHVRINNASGSSLGTADTTTAGTASVNIGSYTGPLVIEVTGGTNVTYYDEGTKLSSAFGAAEVLRAIAPSVMATVGVTAATHASVEAIKSNNGGTIPPAISVDTITNSNHKIAVAFGIKDVLQAPKLVDSSTGSTLVLGTAADEYALQLAAMAKLATTGKTALDVAKDIANDLRDGILDGKYTPASGPVVPNSATTYTQASIQTDFAAQQKSAADDLGTTDTKNLVNNDSTTLGAVTTDVTAIVTPPAGVSLPDVQLAKNIFSELRTTLSSFANSSKTGFLNNQASRIDADLKLVVTPEAAKVSSRLGLVSMAVQTFEGAQTGPTSSNGIQSGTGTPDDPTAAIWFSQNGSLDAVVAGRNGVQYCYIPKTAISGPVTCFTAGVDSVISNTNSIANIKLIKLVLTPTAPNAYSYVATRENRTWDTSNSILGSAVQVPVLACGSGCIGTVSKTGTTSMILAGTLPPSTPNSGADTWDISVVKSQIGTTSSYHYAMSGKVSTVSTATPAKPVAFSFDNGSYIDLDETNTSTGNQLVTFNLIGTAKTDATKLTGTLTISGVTKDKSTTNTIASNVVFDGVISDTSAGGAGDMLTGKLVATVTNYSAYDVTLPTSDSNYIHGTAMFTGTIQAPSRPLMKLVISGSSTGANAGSATVNYTYGTISITATGTSSPSAGTTVTLTNQDGIQIAADPKVANQQLITKAGVTLATVSSKVINYVDGSSESLN